MRRKNSSNLWCFIISCLFSLVFSACNSGRVTETTADTIVVATDTDFSLPQCQAMSDELASKSMALSQQNSLWETFRERFPYHIQLVGHSAIMPDRSFVLLLSEPGPDITLDGVNSILSCFSHKTSILKHPIGYDGWVKDIVITVADVGISDLENITGKLNKYLFKTSYGAYSLQLQPEYKSKYKASSASDLNYKIAPNELETWFLGSNALKFDDGTIEQIIGATSAGRASIHYSEKKGFVTWVIPQGADLANEKENIRKFALDADLIIGAIAKDNRLAIIGRERISSVYDLPPLRTETVLQLGAANEKELAQSYERNNIMACKLPNGQDWAPIYLSDELINTEYGSLLNITDQLLKSWSQNGETNYVNFNYQHPEKWGFSRSLADLMYAKFNNLSLTYNWNTSGAAYQFTGSNYEIVGLNRVGSLPVSYIPDDQSSGTNDQYKNVEPYEQRGYNFFSDCNDANLVRAAQYAALYQIFKAYKINNSDAHKSSFNAFKPLEEQASAFLINLRLMTDAEIKDLVEAPVRKSFKEEMQSRHPGTSDKFLDLMTDEYIQEQNAHGSILRQKRAIKHTQLDLEKLAADPMGQMAVVQMLVNRNGIQKLGNLSLTNENIERYQQIEHDLSDIGFLKWDFAQLGIKADSVIKDYVAYNDGSGAVWIKTPSVVISKNKNSFESYGGHNIDASLLKVEFDNNAKKGSLTIENGVVKIHPEDQARLSPEMLRKLGVEVKNDKIKNRSGIETFSFTGGPPKPPRNIETVFADAGSTADSRGFTMGVHDILEVRPFKNNSYRVGNRVVNSCEELQHVLFVHAKQNKAAAIEFVDMGKNAVEVRLKGVEMEMHTEAGLIGEFRPMSPEETMLLTTDGKSSFNRTLFRFESEPVETTSALGKESIEVELEAMDNSGSLFVHAESKSKNAFTRIKDAFRKAFNFSKRNDVDFVRKTYSEILQTGLTKNDFALIVSNTKDCPLCRSKPLKHSSIYVAILKTPPTVKSCL